MSKGTGSPASPPTAPPPTWPPWTCGTGGGARCEDRIRHAKDTGARNLPYKDFAANTVWLQIVLLAQLLTAHLQRLALTGELALAEPERLCGGEDLWCPWPVAVQVEDAFSAGADQAPGHGEDPQPQRLNTFAQAA